MPQAVDLSDLTDGPKSGGSSPPAAGAVDLSDLVDHPKPSLGREALDAFADIPRETAHEFLEEGRKAAADIKANQGPKSVFALGPTHQELGALMHTLGQAGSLVTGPLTSVLGRPVETATHGKVPKETVGNLAATVLPFAQEAAAARDIAGTAKELGIGGSALKHAMDRGVVARKALKGGADPYREAVDLLKREGVEITPGRQRDRYAKRVEESLKSSAHVGHGIREAERQSLLDMNRAFYNRALKPLGLKATKDVLPDARIGNEGVAHLEQKFHDAYDAVKPHIEFKVDDEFRAGDRALRKEIDGLPAKQKEHVFHILRTRLDPELRTGKLDGEQFKKVDSALGMHARLLSKSQDPYDREAGDILEQVQGLIRENTERHSDPKIIKRLKDINNGWAQYVRIRTAAANRAKSDGIFTPGDILQAIKREDSSVGKGAFARGEALLQDLARAGNRVLSDVVPDSGTAERTMQNHRGLGGLVLGGMIGHVPGALVGGALDFLSAPYTNRGARELMHILSKVEPKNPGLRAGAPKASQRPIVPALAAEKAAADGQEAP